MILLRYECLANSLVHASFFHKTGDTFYYCEVHDMPWERFVAIRWEHDASDMGDDMDTTPMERPVLKRKYCS